MSRDLAKKKAHDARRHREQPGCDGFLKHPDTDAESGAAGMEASHE